MAKDRMRAMFGNLKSRITGRREEDDREYDDYDEEYDDYEEDYESYENVDRTVAERDSRSSERYEEDSSRRFAEEMDARYSKAVTTRPSRAYQSPRLVSIDDVRANTQVYTGSSYAGESGSYAAEERRASSRATGSLTPVGTAASSVGGAGGLDSLFASTSVEVDTWGTGEFGATNTRRFGAARSLEVIRPLSYSEAERVAKGLKAGDAVVLSLKSTPDQLASRLVVFAFGVACALDATVERLCPKVYAITCNADLTDNERSMLKSQGVI